MTWKVKVKKSIICNKFETWLRFLTMRGRIFFRIMLDNLFVNNAFCKTIRALLNFCNEQSYYGQKKLKFLKNVPLNNIEHQNTYEKRFLFTSNPKSGVNYK